MLKSPWHGPPNFLGRFRLHRSNLFVWLCSRTITEFVFYESFHIKEFKQNTPELLKQCLPHLYAWQLWSLTHHLLVNHHLCDNMIYYLYHWCYWTICFELLNCIKKYPHMWEGRRLICYDTMFYTMYVLLFHSLGVCVILTRSLTKKLSIIFENSNLFIYPCWILKIYSI